MTARLIVGNFLSPAGNGRGLESAGMERGSVEKEGEKK
jgi:hypothetical protein